MPVNNLPKGKRGEDVTAEYLRRKGFRIIFRNFRIRNGEIDIIAIEARTLVFVEVKTRWGTKFGTPKEAVTPWKLRTLTHTAEYFKLLHPELPNAMRIDVVAVQLDDQGKLVSIEHLPNVTG